MVILDTNVIVEHLRRPAVETTLVQIIKELGSQHLAVAIISIQELFNGTSTRDQQPRDKLWTTIKPLRVLAYTHEVAQTAGEIMRDLKPPIDFADAAIAATAIVNRAELLTLNTKHFRDIPGLKLFKM